MPKMGVLKLGNTFVKIPFSNQKVHLDGSIFNECKFKNCELIYSGGIPPSMVGCEVENSRFGFEGAASNTLAFLHAMNNGGFRSVIHSTIVALTSPEPMPGQSQ